MSTALPQNIEVKDAHIHNLKHIDVKIPLHRFVTISGLSGSGKSSLALGTLYAEGSRRYLEALSTYTRRRITQAASSQVQDIKYLPAAIALRQRPSVPNIRSTVGTMTEGLNVLRLMFSRLASHQCPNGHQVPANIGVAQAMAVAGAEMGRITCPTCGVRFSVPSAEDFAFNAAGACPTCGGLGRIRQIDPTTLISDPDKTILDGAVASWRLPGRNFMPYVAEQIGVRINVPYKELTATEKNIVLHGAKKQYKISIPTATGRVFNMDHALYENAYDAVTDTAKNTHNERTLKRLDKFYNFGICPDCHGTRFAPKLLTSLLAGKNIAQVSQFTIAQLLNFSQDLTHYFPDNMQLLVKRLQTELTHTLQPLVDLGLDYLTLDRAGQTLSTGELQRIQLTKTLQNETTGILYVLDEPSVGLHPDNVTGLIQIFKRLVALGNSLIVVEHDPAIIAASDYIIEIGPGAGREGGRVIDQGTPKAIMASPKSLIGPYLSGRANILSHPQTRGDLFAHGKLGIQIKHKFNLDHLTVDFPLNRLSVVSGFSGAGKTTLILNSLVPAILAQTKQQPLPTHVAKLTNDYIRHVQMIDSTPIGKTNRSTVATYSGILDHVRQIFAQTDLAQQRQYTASYFSYNLKYGACPTCGGTGTIDLDIQYLPEIQQICPACHGKRYNPDILAVKWQGYSIADILALSVTEALPFFQHEPAIYTTLQTLAAMGLGYLTLGESTPILSGGEAQRLKLVTQMGRIQKDTLYVFDEPSVGLHPQDIQTLIKVFDALLADGATIIVIEHDLDIIANADYNLDLGPKGGAAGGQILYAGPRADFVKAPKSITARYLKQLLTHNNSI
ncbi:excinuclease ABC subunit UvrA [Agrilactobacillus fermenti]|uniref:excinuclease ABC subunit UvrA n=1 Tax=Agrilactobacillus fermenti TaxID=2586909 RepID=UPI003A5B9FB0